MVKETIDMKFYAFKYTFEMFQNKMVIWPTKSANI